tara:strand:- start:264887 stop:265474 length:588 start_codon:yes stop_codon:yes gene_type:complete
MKKLILFFIILTSLTFPPNAHAMDPKAKAFGIMCAYGTVGGALLGFASMAFGANSRAIAQGASLGLYAGIIFGSYVLTSYKDPNAPDNYDDPYAPPEGVDPYAPPPGSGYGTPGGYGAPAGYGAPPAGGGYGAPAGGGYQGGGGYAPPAEAEDQGGFFGPPNRALEIQNEYLYNYQLKKGSRTPPLYMNLVNVQF